jgi:adenosylcobinamide kinase/adenosylcobinamide-phosphate guanylyltransferase
MMANIVLVTGGARSGKSTYAENLAKKGSDKVLYLATAIPFDDEMKDRVKKHKESRPKLWGTFEGYKDLENIFSKEAFSYDIILLDCVTIMVNNLMFDAMGDSIDSLNEEELNDIEKSILFQISKFLHAAENTNKTIILVTNEIGYGIVPEYKLARVFRDIAGRVNQYIAQKANEVYLIVCGFPVKVK